MSETQATGSVPVRVVARVYGKDQSWVRAGIVCGWLPITLNFVEMTIDGIYRGDEIKEDDGPNTYHQRTSNSNNQIFWLETTMKNIGTTKFSLWGINKYIAEITFDDTYTYEAKISKLVGMGNSELTPFESAKVYIWSEIPIEMLDTYENAVIRFAFNDGFERAETEAFESMKHCFELNA